VTLFTDALAHALNAYDLIIDEQTLLKLEAHWRLVTEYNKKFNLTAILEEQAALYKHYVDCLLLLPLLKKEMKNAAPFVAADIGSGAGFPGLVLAIACPQSTWYLLEATHKKCSFLELCGKNLSLDNIHALPQRAETAGQGSLRASFDFTAARAIAPLTVLLEYALPLLKERGLFIAAKGPALSQEEEAAATALRLLGAQAEFKQQFTLPHNEQRILACYRKISPTPAPYPRRPGLPEKRPL